MWGRLSHSLLIIIIKYIYSRDDGLWLLGLDHKTHCCFLLAVSLISLALGKKPVAFITRTIKQPYGEVHMVRNYWLLPIVILKVDPPTLVMTSDDYNFSKPGRTETLS